MFRIAAAAAVALALAVPAVAAPAKAPKVSIASFTQLKTPLPYPYDEKGDANAKAADAKVAAAKAKAKASGKLLLIDLGGNWCGWCRSLAAVLELPEAKPFVQQNFEVVMVNVSSAKGMTDKNNQVLKRFGIERSARALPHR